MPDVAREADDSAEENDWPSTRLGLWHRRPNANETANARLPSFFDIISVRV
jgi:hypothetical protein